MLTVLYLNTTLVVPTDSLASRSLTQRLDATGEGGVGGDDPRSYTNIIALYLVNGKCKRNLSRVDSASTTRSHVVQSPYDSNRATLLVPERHLTALATDARTLDPRQELSKTVATQRRGGTGMGWSFCVIR